jgi:hypothetical protein
MRVAMRKGSMSALPRREQMLSARTRTPALRVVHPEIGQLRIELTFNDHSAHTPSPQQHTLYPAAPAFFRFACPCTDCDGDFDLSGAVHTALESSAWHKRGTGTSTGSLPCQGVRLHDRAGNKGCAMKLDFKLVAAPAPKSKS